ncbi:MAG: hypothetical protein ACI4KL_06395 [Lentihominibacter sp.]
MKLRKTIIVACCVIIATMGIALAGCGGGGEKYADSPYVGTWAANTAEYSGVEVDVNEVIGAFEITLNADGSATMLEEGDTLDSKWEPTENGVKMKDAASEVDFTYEDGKLVTEQSGVTFYFEKK